MHDPHKAPGWIYYVAQIGHELRTPLNAIQGFGRLLKSESAGTLNDQQHLYLDKMLGSSDDLLIIVNQILDWAKLESGQSAFMLEPFDLRILIHELADSYRLQCEQAALAMTIAVDHPMKVFGDRGKSKQVLINLISNALKYVPAGGHVHITAEEDASHYHLRFTDDGPGVPDADVERIFEPFNNGSAVANNRSKGTGLGLSTARTIMQGQHGDLVLVPQKTPGAVFVASFPKMEEAS